MKYRVANLGLPATHEQIVAAAMMMACLRVCSSMDFDRRAWESFNCMGTYAHGILRYLYSVPDALARSFHR
jgi:hypothetical protein